MMTALDALRSACVAAASEETAYGEYDPSRSALHGHCGAVSYVVQSKLGGRIVAATVDGERHLWNVLEDGSEIDLTSDQFGGDGLNPVSRGRICPERKGVNPRFRLFGERVAAVLKA